MGLVRISVQILNRTDMILVVQHIWGLIRRSEIRILQTPSHKITSVDPLWPERFCADSPQCWKYCSLNGPFSVNAEADGLIIPSLHSTHLHHFPAFIGHDVLLTGWRLQRPEAGICQDVGYFHIFSWSSNFVTIYGLLELQYEVKEWNCLLFLVLDYKPSEPSVSQCVIHYRRSSTHSKSVSWFYWYRKFWQLYAEYGGSKLLHLFLGCQVAVVSAFWDGNMDLLIDRSVHHFGVKYFCNH